MRIIHFQEDRDLGRLGAYLWKRYLAPQFGFFRLRLAQEFLVHRHGELRI